MSTHLPAHHSPRPVRGQSYLTGPGSPWGQAAGEPQSGFKPAPPPPLRGLIPGRLRPPAAAGASEPPASTPGRRPQPIEGA